MAVLESSIDPFRVGSSSSGTGCIMTRAEMLLFVTSALMAVESVKMEDSGNVNWKNACSLVEVPSCQVHIQKVGSWTLRSSVEVSATSLNFCYV